jgi:ATP-dependent DNA helicase RecG
MKENQRLEWKESWRDEYLRWICGFANAEGGKLVIGMDDRGVVKGVAQAQRLLDELPNKIRDILGVMADVRLAALAETDFAGRSQSAGRTGNSPRVSSKKEPAMS